MIDIYDTLIHEILAALTDHPGKKWLYNESDAQCNSEKAQLILSREAAYELGGSAKPCANCTLFTTGENARDTVELHGPDIPNINSDCEFARLTILSLYDVGENDDEVYRRLKELEMVKYRVFPSGYMPRISTGTQREQVRVSKDSVSDGRSFYNIGCSYIREYKRNPLVAGVRVVFVTSPHCDWKTIQACSKKAALLTETLNTIEKLEAECDTCRLKPICDEVEGLRQLHFGMGAKK